MMDNRRQVRRRPVIRVFVSSTFADLKHERDALQRDVFPKLEQLCASRQFQFQAIDLRWGVPTEASLDHRTMRICFEELRRSQEISPQPNFLILLGDRYGWRPLPEEISEEEFRKLESTRHLTPALSPFEAERESAAGQILRAWYQRDENALPPVYLLQSRKKNLNDGRNYTSDQVWNEVQRVLWDIINRAYPAAQLAGRFDHLARLDEPLPFIVRFQASATEQEIWRGALGARNARQHVLAFVREIENVEEFQPVQIRDFGDVDELGAINVVARNALRELKKQLRERLGEDNVIGIKHARLVHATNEKGELSFDVTTEHLAELCARVHAALKNIITKQMDEYWGTADPTVVSPRELELERSEHQRFGQERAPANSFVGRKRHLQAIHAYLHNNSNQPLVIHGASGCGKTALLARAAQDAGPELKPVIRFIGVTPRSSDVRSLLASLCQELRQRHPLESPLSSDVRELTKELHEHFKKATAEGSLILFLDALDQLGDADKGPSLFWIPFGQLPAHVKLIVSCLSDRAPEDPAGQPYTVLKSRGLVEENFINLDALSEDEAQTLLFERWLPQAGRRLNAEQAQCIRERLKSDVCRQPLYLKVLFEEARLWRSDDPAPTLGHNVSDLLSTLFERLGDLSNHGPTLECALGYIAAARRGLTEMEILEVLYQDPDYAKFLEQMTARTGHELPDNPKRIPIAMWSRLRFDLVPYLAVHAAPGGTVLNFYHRQVADVVRSQFLDTPQKKQTRHERLAEYFKMTTGSISRKAEELPWQCAKAKLYDELVKVLTDIEIFLTLSRENRHEIWHYWQAMPAHRKDFAKAYEGAVDFWKHALGETERFELALNELEHFFLISGERYQAIRFAHVSYELAKRLYPEDDIRVAIRSNNLSTALYHEGRFEESVAFALKAQPAYEREFAEKTVDRWCPENNRAMSLFRLGKFGEAEALMRSLVLNARTHLGEANTYTLTAILNLGRILQCKGQFAAATSLFEEALAGRKLVCGEDHPITREAKGLLREHLQDFICTDPATAQRNLDLLLRALITRQRSAQESLSPRQVRQLAFDAYQGGNYAKATELLSGLVQQGFEVPSVLCHLARIALITDQLGEAQRHVTGAWAQRAEAPANMIPRILWLRLCLVLLQAHRSHSTDTAHLLGQLKTALQHKDALSEWAMNLVLTHLQPQLPDKSHALLSVLVSVIRGAVALGELDTFPEWRDQIPVPID